MYIYNFCKYYLNFADLLIDWFVEFAHIDCFKSWKKHTLVDFILIFILVCVPAILFV